MEVFGPTQSAISGKTFLFGAWGQDSSIRHRKDTLAGYRVFQIDSSVLLLWRK
jgi:hypothetical protein